MVNAQRFNPSKRQFGKENYYEVLLDLVPDLYLQEDLNLSGTQTDPINLIINSHILASDDFANVIFVSSVGDWQNMSNVSGISQFFIKQNNLTEVSPSKFELDILIPLDKSFRDFDTSAEFSTYVNSTLLPAIQLNSPDAAFGGSVSASHEYLLNSLGWMYILNASGSFDSEPSSLVHDLVVGKLFRGQEVLINDGVKNYTDHLWSNLTTCTTYSNFIPSDFQPGTGTYTSGTQNLEKLKTLIDVAYSPLFLDSQDIKVQTAFDDYISTGEVLDDITSKGPFFRLIKAFSYAFADTNNSISEIETLYDIEQCPSKFLPLLAELIGWKLFGSEPDRWRLQLINAVNIYKHTGTKASIKLAVDSLFAQDVFDVNSKIHELWESYIPALAYYAIATDSSDFKDFSTWTEKIATDMGVSGYSNKSMDDNIRLAVDTILLSLVGEFPDHFLLGGKEFPIGTSSFVFNYRERDFPIPPWEEIPYYTQCLISPAFVDSFIDKLACFGVTSSFAIQVGNFIRENTIDATDDIREGNGWLIFTPDMEVAPNYDSVLLDPQNNREEALSIWSGKSSHYKLLFNASSFDFSKDTLETDSRTAILEASRIADTFSPAHAIQDTRVFLADLDDYTASAVSIPILDFVRNELMLGVDLYNTQKAYFRGSVSATNMSLDASTYTPRRDTLNQLQVSAFTTTNVVSKARNTYRRRNYKYTPQMVNYYSLDGANMPTSWDGSTVETSWSNDLGSTDDGSTGFLPLGFIPSSLSYHPVFSGTPVNSLAMASGVYGRCQDLSSSSSFFGVYVSSTFPCMGLSALRSNSKGESRPDRYVDMGRIDPIIPLMHKIAESKGKLKWKQFTESEAEIANYRPDNYWYNASDSLYFSAYDEMFPVSKADYRDFEFGVGVARLYSLFKESGFAALSPANSEEDGKHFFARTYGSLFTNSDLSITGLDFSVINTNLSSVTVLTPANIASLAPNTNIFSTAFSEDYHVPVYGIKDSTPEELRNRRIIDNVDLVHVSATSPQNAITVYDLDASLERPSRENYTINQTLIRMKSIDGLSRIRFESGWDTNTSGVSPVLENNIRPDHEHKITVRALAANEDGVRLGGAKVGVWIHTSSEDGFVWHFTPEGKWVVTSSADEITKNKIITEFAHITDFKESKRKLQIGASGNETPFQCLEVITAVEVNEPVISTFRENEFTDIEINFNTFNQPICLPSEYHRQFGQVHMIDATGTKKPKVFQNYTIEIFMLPSSSNKDKFVLVDSINLRDETMFNWTKIPVEEFDELYDEVAIERQEMRTIMKFFSELQGTVGGQNLRSTVIADTSGIFEVSGGSRINLRENPEWEGSYSTTATGNYLSSLEIEN